MTAAPALTAQSTMQEILQTCPGAQRALFRRYHLGGCASCGFQPSETLQQVCRRNNIQNINQVIEHILASHEADARLLIDPAALRDWLQRDPDLQLLDVRSREEFEAVHIQGSVLLSQPLMQAILAPDRAAQPIVIIDHQGRHSLDAAAYLIGHGATQVRCLRGGIDAWSLEVDPSLPRYRFG